ncbi:hypothetical protein, partial [Burkholderia sp. SIMBA_024]|uniref:ADP-ribosyltransferase-containing protein n=1 Tax=Burkholderia sp. SIMBA_024 TaxID=3085768 RepID=UPI00397884AE
MLAQTSGRHRVHKHLRIFPLYARIENPFHTDDYTANKADELIRKAIDNARARGMPDRVLTELQVMRQAANMMKRAGDDAGEMDIAHEALQSIGYDGIEYDNAMEDKGSTSYVVFNPDQLKSPFNVGLWQRKDVEAGGAD